jgi:hypothetical protein
MLCRASRRLDVGPTCLDGSTADREVNEPLPPYQRSRSGLDEVPWQSSQADGVWRPDGRGLELAMATQSATAAPSEPPRTLLQLQGFFATRPQRECRPGPGLLGQAGPG